MKFLIEWVKNGKNACAEEQATLCYLQILVNGENACAFYDVSEGQHLNTFIFLRFILRKGLQMDGGIYLGVGIGIFQYLHIEMVLRFPI